VHGNLMYIWEQIERLLEGPEKDALKGGAGGAPPREPPAGPAAKEKCVHGMTKGTCATCASIHGGKGAYDKELKYEAGEEDIGDFLRRTVSDRNSDTLDAATWNKKIDEWVKLVNKRKNAKNKKEKLGKTPDHFYKRWKELEQKAANAGGETGPSGVAELRKQEYQDGTSWDGYIEMVAGEQFKHSFTALKQNIRDEMAQRLEHETEDPSLLQGSNEYQFDAAGHEMLSLEFKEFEKWARNAWSMYGVDESGKHLPFDEDAFNQTLRYFAETGHPFETSTPDDPEKVKARQQASAEKAKSAAASQPEAMSKEQEAEFYRQQLIKQGKLKEAIIQGTEPGQISRDRTSSRGKMQPGADVMKSEEPLYKKLMRMDQGVAGTIFVSQMKQNMKHNTNIKSQAQQQIDSPMPMPKMPAGLNPEQQAQWQKKQQDKGEIIPFGEPTPKQTDVFKPPERNYQNPKSGPKKLPSWWNMGFKGDIPYTDM